MMIHHIQTLVKNLVGLPSKANANSDDEDSAVFDLTVLGQFHSGNVLCQVGTPTGSPSAFSVVFKIEESDDGSAWSDVEGATVTLDAADTFGEIDFFPNERKEQIRLNRVVSTTAGTAPKVPNSAILQLASGRTTPG